MIVSYITILTFSWFFYSHRHCHCSHFVVQIQFAHLLPGRFHCWNFSLPANHLYSRFLLLVGKINTSKVLLAFVTLAQKQAPEGIAVGNKRNWNWKVAALNCIWQQIAKYSTAKYSSEIPCAAIHSISSFTKQDRSFWFFGVILLSIFTYSSDSGRSDRTQDHEITQQVIFLHLLV